MTQALPHPFLLIKILKFGIILFVILSGKGSVLTLEGEIEMEALICEGKNLKSGKPR
jgi:hypothetical protein